jgi:hypothetical protein
VPASAAENVNVQRWRDSLYPMRAAVRRLRWTDLERVAATERPELPTLLEMYVGPVDGVGEEQFQVLVTDVAALANVVAHERFVIGRHYLIVSEFDQHKIEEFLRKRVGSAAAQDWESLAEQVGRIGFWEFEDYEEGPSRYVKGANIQTSDHDHDRAGPPDVRCSSRPESRRQSQRRFSRATPYRNWAASLRPERRRLPRAKSGVQPMNPCVEGWAPQWPLARDECR